MADPPEDIAVLKAALAVAERRADLAEADAAHAKVKASGIKALVAHLKLQIEKLKRELYGTSSERTAGYAGRQAAPHARRQGYDGDEVRQFLLLKGVMPVIPPKTNRRTPAAYDFLQYRDRNHNHIERMFKRLKQARRIATRYDWTSKSFLAFLCLAASRIWLK